MLDSLEIAQELIDLGFHVVSDQAYATGYQHPTLPRAVFVKRNEDKPVRKQPLVINPDYQEASVWGQIKSLAATSPNLGYLSTNLPGFPRGVGTTSRVGIALDVSDAATLRQLLLLLGYKIPPQVPPEAGTSEPSSQECSVLESELTDTEREALIKARIGQGDYRNDLLAYWGGCAVTDCTIPALLRASHIKPWRAASAAERLDPYNGLLLTPNLDLAFDQGLISFDDHGQILLGSDLDPDSARALNLHSHLRLRQIEARHQGYLAWHRDNLFRK